MNNMHAIFDSGSTKEKIIALLSEKWPLTARKIYRNLFGKNGLSITYQAVHKSLKELTENLVLEKKKDGYLINKEWVRKLGEFSEKIKTDLEDSDKRREVKTVHKITFSNHSEFIKFHLGLIEKVIREEKKLNMIFYFRHVPSPNVLSTEDIKRLKPIMPKLNWTIASKYANPLGNWNAKYWRRLGVKVIVGKDIPTDSRMIIMNDYVVNIFSSKDAMKLWDKIYSVKDIHNADVHQITKGDLNREYKTILTIMKDKEIADLLKGS